MSAVTFGQFATRTARRMTDFLASTVSSRIVSPAPVGLPAGAVYFPYEKVIFASTACSQGVFNASMWIAAAQSDVDIVLAHQGRYPVPGILEDVTFSALVHAEGRRHLVEGMSLYWRAGQGYWLIPPASGPFIALDESGPRVTWAAPFVGPHGRASGVAAAAAKIIRATRSPEAA